MIGAGQLGTTFEHVAMMWVRPAHARGTGPDIAFALMRR